MTREKKYVVLLECYGLKICPLKKHFLIYHDYIQAENRTTHLFRTRTRWLQTGHADLCAKYDVVQLKLPFARCCNSLENKFVISNCGFKTNQTEISTEISMYLKQIKYYKDVRKEKKILFHLLKTILTVVLPYSSTSTTDLTSSC